MLEDLAQHWSENKKVRVELVNIHTAKLTVTEDGEYIIYLSKDTPKKFFPVYIAVFLSHEAYHAKLKHLENIFSPQKLRDFIKEIKNMDDIREEKKYQNIKNPEIIKNFLTKCDSGFAFDIMHHILNTMADIHVNINVLKDYPNLKNFYEIVINETHIKVIASYKNKEFIKEFQVMKQLLKEMDYTNLTMQK